ncbi:TPA: hypothetical protein ACQUHN_006284 [Bacillus thuringiensis]
MPHEDQFTAIGPSLTGSGFPRSAFSTKAIDMIFGVNVQGNKCGVYGESFTNSSNTRDTDFPGVGIWGSGQNFGVFGDGNKGIAGVVGRNNKRDLAAVIGSTKKGGVGVFGTTFATLNCEDPAKGLGTGVSGQSKGGFGIFGFSTDSTGRGGAFQCSRAAQIHLVPNSPEYSERRPQLPKDGRSGDLFVAKNNQTQQCSLWFCVQGDDRNNNTPAQWAEVLLGPPFDGQA